MIEIDHVTKRFGGVLAVGADARDGDEGGEVADEVVVVRVQPAEDGVVHGNAPVVRACAVIL